MYYTIECTNVRCVMVVQYTSIITNLQIIFLGNSNECQCDLWWKWHLRQSSLVLWWQKAHGYLEYTNFGMTIFQAFTVKSSHITELRGSSWRTVVLSIIVADMRIVSCEQSWYILVCDICKMNFSLSSMCCLCLFYNITDIASMHVIIHMTALVVGHLPYENIRRYLNNLDL